MKYEQNPSAWWYVVPGVVLGAGIYWYLRSGKAAADAAAADAVDAEDEAVAAAEDKEDRRTRRKECRARKGLYEWNKETKLCESKIIRPTHMQTINLRAMWAGQAKADCPKAPSSLRWKCELDKRMAIGMLESVGLRAE